MLANPIPIRQETRARQADAVLVNAGPSLGALVIAIALTTGWLWLDARLGIRTGLRYAVYEAGDDLRGAPLAAGVVDLPALQGDGVSPQDANRMMRGAGQRSVRWSGRWHVPTSGAYEIFLAGSGLLTVRIDGDRVARNRAATSTRPRPGWSSWRRGYHDLLVTLRRSESRPGDDGSLGAGRRGSPAVLGSGAVAVRPTDLGARGCDAQIAQRQQRLKPRVAPLVRPRKEEPVPVGTRPRAHHGGPGGPVATS